MLALLKIILFLSSFPAATAPQDIAPVTEQTVQQQHFAIFLVPEIDTRALAMQIDQKMRAKQGIDVSRADHFSKKYFVVFDGAQHYDQTTFTEWFAEIGLEIKCYDQGIIGVDPVQHPSMDTCQE